MLYVLLSNDERELIEASDDADACAIAQAELLEVFDAVPPHTNIMHPIAGYVSELVVSSVYRLADGADLQTSELGDCIGQAFAWDAYRAIARLHTDNIAELMSEMEGQS